MVLNNTLTSANLKKFQTGVHYMSVKIYKSLPIYIKNEINITKKFESFTWELILFIGRILQFCIRIHFHSLFLLITF
jgi:hypothetical protein